MNSAAKNVFCTFTFGAGVGGHYFSMKAILAASLFKNTDIIEIGYSQSPIISSLQKYDFVEYSLIRHIQAIRKLKSKLSLYDEVNVFCFDVFSFILLKDMSKHLDTSINLTLVKCGGPDPTLYYPPIENLVCFSEENYNFFTNRNDDGRKCISLIPNRVSKAELSFNQKIDEEIVNIKGVKILCIARIGIEYKKKIELAYKLKEKLKSNGLNCTLIVIGSVVQNDVFEHIKVALTNDIVWLTAPKYTESASDFIDLFDIVVGTGRGAVEALLLNKKTYIPVNNSQDLTLTDENILAELARGNFSGRTIIPNLNEGDILEVRGLPNHDLLKIIEDMFSVENCSIKYQAHISNCQQVVPFDVISRSKAMFYFVYSIFREKSVFFSRFLYPSLKAINAYFKTK